MRLKIEHFNQRLVLTNQVFASTLTTTLALDAESLVLLLKVTSATKLFLP